jgi:hemolysin activation/secretion protein
MALGDALRLRASTAGAPLRHARLAYQRPLGAEGWQAGLAWSELGYRLTRDFAVLDASGTAGGLSAYAQYPLLRSRQINLKLSLTAEHRRLVDRVGQAALRSEKLVDLIGLGLSGDTQAGLLDSWSLTLSGGRLELDPDSAALDALGARSAGRFARVNWNASKAWWLPSPAETWSIAAQVSGQRVLGGRNLDSSEKLGLGGPQAVRAYAQGESPSDDALLLNLELRWRPADSWLLSAFLDGASGRLNHVPTTAPPGGNSRQLSGYGLGAASSIGKTLNWMASLAWRSGDAPRNAADRSVQLWTSVQGIF